MCGACWRQLAAPRGARPVFESRDDSSRTAGAARDAAAAPPTAPREAFSPTAPRRAPPPRTERARPAVGRDAALRTAPAPEFDVEDDVDVGPVPRPLGVSVIAVVVGGIAALMGVGSAYVLATAASIGIFGGAPGALGISIAGSAGLVAALLLLHTARGLWSGRRGARVVTMALGAATLLGGIVTAGANGPGAAALIVVGGAFLGYLELPLVRHYFLAA